MRIAKDTVVTLAYSVRDPDGDMVDEGAEPLVYLHGGYDNLFPKLEEALDGKTVGDSVTVKLQPDEAFGDYDPELLDVADAAHFPPGVSVGMQFERSIEGSDDEPMLFRVTDVEDGKVVLDGNHPLAGIALVFSCKVAAVRAASDEEIAHQHAHHPGHTHH